MLARVVKNQAAADFSSFAVPEIGIAKKPAESHGAFVFPNLVDLGIEEQNPFGGNPTLTIEEAVVNAQAEAAEIIARAEKDSEFITHAALEKGLSEARATADAEIAEQVAAQVAELRGQLTETIQTISALSEEIIEKVEKDVVELAIEIAKKVVGREVTLDREIASTLVKISLGKLHNRSIAEVHLHPDDFSYVETHREKLGFRGALELIEDASISLGGCLIHTETGDIDGRIESQFDEIAYGLLKS